MKNLLRTSLLTMSLLSVLPLTAQAHRQWLLPSATVLSGAEPWLSIDAAVSNDLFYFEHFPLRLDGIKAYAPDGTEVQLENSNTGRYRSTFDVKLSQKGTYKVGRSTETITASYLVNGELKNFRGTPEAFETAVPKNAQDLRIAKAYGRLELFATVGNPTDTVLKPTGKGLEFVPVTHPNDLLAGETAKFRFLMDGKPHSGMEVSLIPGGIRYRDQLGEIKTTTDADGYFSVKWPAPGFYWMEASAGSGGIARRAPAAAPAAGAAPAATQPAAGMGAGGGGGRTMPTGVVEPGVRGSYVATLEVLPQ